MQQTPYEQGMECRHVSQNLYPGLQKCWIVITSNYNAKQHAEQKQKKNLNCGKNEEQIYS